jgi:hypothetical protein
MGWLSYPQLLRIEFTEAWLVPTSPAPGRGLRLVSLRLRPIMMPPGPPGPLRTSVPDGADGHGSAGLPEISEVRVPRVFYHVCMLGGRDILIPLAPRIVDVA